MFSSLAGLFSGIFAASAYTCVRALSKREAPYTIVFYFSLFSVIVLIPFSIATYEPMTKLQIIYLLGAGLSAAVGQIGITLAYSFAPAKDISILRMLLYYLLHYLALYYSEKHQISMHL